MVGITISWTRCSNGSLWSHHGCLEKMLVGSAHGLKAPGGNGGNGGGGGGAVIVGHIIRLTMFPRMSRLGSTR